MLQITRNKENCMFDKEFNVDYDKVAVLKLSKLMKEKNFTFHPLLALEDNFEPVGKDDMEKRKATIAFTKKLNSLSKALDESFDKKFKVYSSFHEFKCVYKLMESATAFNYLAKLYAALDYSLQELNKFLKSQKNVPEVMQDFNGFEELLELNVWDTMNKDFEYFQTVTAKRLARSKERFPKHDMWEQSEPNMEKVKELYKETLKKLKESK